MLVYMTRGRKLRMWLQNVSTSLCSIVCCITHIHSTVC